MVSDQLGEFCQIKTGFANAWMLNWNCHYERRVSMFERFQSKINSLIQDSINTPGDTTFVLRQNIMNQGMSQIDAQNQFAVSLPSELTEFLDKITFSPFDIHDDDIEVLNKAGYSDDAIIEIISCASIAAGIGRLEIVKAAMGKGAE